jgi:hypothetical protein
MAFAAGWQWLLVMQTVPYFYQRRLTIGSPVVSTLSYLVQLAAEFWLSVAR